MTDEYFQPYRHSAAFAVNQIKLLAQLKDRAAFLGRRLSGSLCAPDRRELLMLLDSTKQQIAAIDESLEQTLTQKAA
jgi:hypothetical protein